MSPAYARPWTRQTFADTATARVPEGTSHLAYGDVVPSEVIEGIVSRLASRKPVRPEAEIQADIYSLLTLAPLGLDESDARKMESPVADGTRRRIDVEAEHVVIEVKKDLRVGNLAEYESQLAGYVQQRTTELASRYVGILTDGTTWRLYHLLDGELAYVSDLALTPQRPDAERLLVWLESVMATREQIKPTPAEIEERLAADSPGHHLDHASLAALYEANKDHPEVKLKRELWAKLLRTAFGKQFTDDPDLFINHTLLVVTAELIAHAAIGWDISPHGPLSPVQLISGSEFQASQIHGVIEADFFDWVTQVEGGGTFVSELGRRLSRFNWNEVEHDVLKILYESVIPTQERERLGEYYTPDWLADRVVHETVTDPLNMRVADPSCGSGTFLFHAIRRYLDAAEAGGAPPNKALDHVTAQVVGMDVHPVAVTLARVTYLLAIGLDRIQHPDRGPLTIPVYLGDSMQWEQRRDLIDGGELVTVATEGDELVEGGGVLFGDDLVFPRSVLADAGRFDRLVTEMADRALDVRVFKNGKLMRTDVELIDPVLKNFGVTEDEGKVLTTTFSTMRALHRTGRNHIWGYYVRNLIRPLWLSEPANRVDVMVGNPPWLRYSKMTANMQERYKNLAKPRNLLTGGLGASSRDLSTLFVVRAVELYLRAGGRFAFVMPHGILTRKPHTGFRTGEWETRTSEPLAVRFAESWDLANATTGFPMVSCVVFGDRSAIPAPLPSETVCWTGRLPRADVPWAEASAKITTAPGRIVAHAAGAEVPTSPYKNLFRQGAVLAPRVCLFVTETSAGPLGAGAGRVAVVSHRSTLEKEPWKSLPSLQARVESRFVRPVYLGETILPFRSVRPRKAVLPVMDELMSAEEIEQSPGLLSWWEPAEAAWEKDKPSQDRSRLLDRIDYHGQLSAQFPLAHRRVVYTKAGNTLAATVIEDPRAVIDTSLYWSSVASEAEANYLCAVLNSAELLARVKPLQTLGLFGARHFDKYVFLVPFPKFDPTSELHQRIAALGVDAAEVAAAVDVTGARTFQAARKLVAAGIAEQGVSAEINETIRRLLGDD